VYEVIVHEWAEEVLSALVKKDAKTFEKISNALDELEEKGLISTNTKKLLNTNAIFRKRVGRWRILFTSDKNVFHVWIVAVEKDTKKDYKKWIRLISYQKE
jgi:mRNA-degrading endonuclease RelE of RelBE toxin-antitoxin system